MPNIVKVDISSFRNALDIAICPSKSTIAVLTNVHVRCELDRIFVESTDLNHFVSTEVEARCENCDAFLVPWKSALDILKGEKGDITLTSTKHTLLLSFGEYLFTLETLYALDYPTIPAMPAPSFHLSSEWMGDSLKKVLPCVSRGDSRYTLKGVLLEISNGNVFLAATDGSRLSVVDDGGNNSVPKEITSTKIIIPVIAAKWLLENVQKKDIAVALGAGVGNRKQHFFYIPEIRTSIAVSPLSGSFPVWREVMPRKDTIKHKVTFPLPATFSKAVDRVSKMADTDKSVRFTINGKFEISSISSIGRAVAVVPEASVEHLDITQCDLILNVNSTYLQDFLKTADKDSVTLSFRDGVSVVLFEVPNMVGYSYVLMPLRS